MSDTRPDDSPRPHSRSVTYIATSNKASPGCGGLVVAASAIIHAFSQRKKNNQDKSLSQKKTNNEDKLLVISNEEKNLGISPKKLEIFSLEDLQVATDNFSHKNILGRGGSGTFYKGRLSDGSLVAVKRLSVKCTQGVLEFQTEVEKISKAIHRNLLCPCGYFLTPEERILVYPFMPNGSVASCLFERSESQPPLSWEIRKQIAFEAARGLTYLHEDFDPKMIHRDVKATNIFLDEDLEAVVGDFGLSIPMNFKDTHVTTSRLTGTFEYMAPEYLHMGEFSEKTDIFGYGIMLFELVSGQKASGLAKLASEEDGMLHNWAEGLVKEKKFDTLVDADLDGNFFGDEVEELLRIALLCTRISPMERPKMSEIVRLLSDLFNKRSHWDTNLNTPTRSSRVPQQSSSSRASGFTGTQRRLTKAQSRAGKKSARSDKVWWLECFSLKEIVKATNGFNSTFILGKGAFGNVYKGRLPNGGVVAIKRQVLRDKKIHTNTKQNQVGEVQFKAEIEMIGKAKHRNLLWLLGYCETPTERILVYPFMVNGDVASWLKGQDGVKPLPWEIRKKIAVGAAKGLAYLHDDCEPKIIHRDVKAANILLDWDFEAKVADFGLVKFLEPEDTHVTTDVRGTPGYIAAEDYYTRRSSTRTDVFGYGHTLLEIISGRRPYDLATTANNSDITFTEWMGRKLKEKKLDTIVDARLQGNYVEDEVERFIQVALLCIQYSAKKRPKMSEVVTMLEGRDSKSIDTRWEELKCLMALEPIRHNLSIDGLYFTNPEDDVLSGPR